MRNKTPKKFKNKLGQRQLVTQDDFYIEATEYEEQAERWMLSDIKKSLRFYLQALEAYERGLNASNATSEGTYNIMYNQTRLFLNIYTEYLANNGYINLLQYVRLDDIPEMSRLTLPLPEIVQRFEDVYQKLYDQHTWDLTSNLLTCYLSLLESTDTYKLSGDYMIQLTSKFVELTQLSVEYQLAELQSWNSVEENEEHDDDLQRDMINDGMESLPKDGSGISVAPNQNESNDVEENMEMSDQVTAATLSEVLVNGFKFVQCLMEIIIENRLGKLSDVILNPVQSNFLEEMANKFTLQLSDIYKTSCASFPLDQKEIEIVLMESEGLKIIATGDIDYLERYISGIMPSSDLDTDLLLAKVDILAFALSCVEEENLEVQWKACGMLGKVLNETRSMLSTLRQDIISGKLRSMSDHLSRLVFQQCDVLVSLSDNELRRWVIKRSQEKNNSSTLDVLMKNSKTFLVNASKIAERPCGLEECIVDKLKRNYIYNQAQARLSLLDSEIEITSDMTSIPDVLSDHPFYRQLQCRRS